MKDMHSPKSMGYEKGAMGGRSASMFPSGRDGLMVVQSGARSENSLGRPVRILVAEDHDDTREALTLLLELEGYEVCAARDGQEALTLALERRPDIVITDFDMPRMDGAGLSRALRASSHRLGNIPIVVLTALGWSLVQRAMEAGADMHMAKPVDFNLLGATLAGLVNRIREASSAHTSSGAAGVTESAH